MRISRFLLTVAMLLLMPSITVCGKEASQDSTGKTVANTGESITTLTSITVAIIDFESNAPGNPELGQQLGDILTARLSIYDQFQLVERKKLEDLLKEHQLNLTGMVDTHQATKVGKMLGAKIMIFGRAFPVDKDLYLVAKIVGTETSQVKGVMAKGKLESNLSDIIDQLVDKLVEGLEKWTPQLLPKNEKIVNKISLLQRKVKGMKLPTVAVWIPEMHVNRLVIDPAAETEIKQILQKVGFTVINIENIKDDTNLRDVDILITGEGFSEFGTRIGGLVSCVARLEIQVTDCDTHKIILSERTTKRAVDLSEAIAGKTALQAAGHELAINTIEKIVAQISKEQDTTSSRN